MYFDEVMNLVYLLKMYYDVNKENFKMIMPFGDISNDWYYDNYYDICLSISDSLFEYTQNFYYEKKGLSVVVLSDKAVEEFYILAGKFGKLNGINDNENPYFKEAEEEMSKSFYFSFNLGWVLKGYAAPKRKCHSRFALIIDEYGDGVDVCGIAIGLLKMYRFFHEKRDELLNLLSQKEAVVS